MEAENQRLEDENNRQNRRLVVIVENVWEMSTLATSFYKLETNMEGMLKEQEKQGKRLETLESRDGEMWRKVTSYVLTCVVGAVLALVFTHIGL